ncbi:PQQ-binding-like beta-propeller repeat protein [Stieleria marina]|uniref:Outer membrane biogenesis protein BamB n=1 Tax=Stieleria marina TaxID=1930275 RepID=A0A517NNF4_9BACT|nr:outer membrane biogenesis protein BamB [Planctomycetes bacterium K23_9]
MKQELSAWSLVFGAAFLGSIATMAVSGCKPPASTNVNLSTNVTATASNVTANGSNTTTANSNITTGTGTPIETPVTTANESSAPSTEPVANKPVSKKPASIESAASKVAVASTAAATTLVGINDFVAPEKVISSGGDWPQWGGTRLKNNVPNAKNMPLQWDIGKFDRKTGDWDDSKAENIRWVANLGSQTYGNPVVSGGKVFVGTNNGAGHLQRYPSQVDLGCLLAFDEASGEFLWQHSSEKLITGRVHDWPLQGICCAPLVEGDRLWFVTSRGEVRCLDSDGFYDGEDDGPVKDEAALVVDIMNAGPTAAAHAEALAALGENKLTDAVKEMLAEAGEEVDGDVKVEAVTAGKVWKATGKFGGVDRTLTIKQMGPRINIYKALGVDDKRDADVIWVFNMMQELGTSQHNMCSCSVTSYGDLLFVNTSNGLDESHINLPAPKAPSFFCIDKNTGKVLWTDASPGENILHGQWSSPAVAELGGVPQVLFAGGEGIVYSFKADGGSDGKAELLWKFDANPKTSQWKLGGEGTRNNIIATPVVYEGMVYVAVGQDPEHGEGEGHLWCIDPTKRGDVSPQLAMKVEGDKRTPIAHKRLQAVEEEKGEVAVDNPNSAVVWHYSLFDQNGDDSIDFEEEMHRSCGTCAIKDDVLYIADFSGLVHCLDAKGKDGKPVVHFTYDMLAQSWGSPLIADGHVFIGDEDGDVSIFEFGPDNKEPMEEINMGSSVYSTPVAANETIYISTKDKLFAIGKAKE